MRKTSENFCAKAVRRKRLPEETKVERKIHISAGQEYDAYVGNGLLEKCGEMCKRAGLKGKAAIVTDSNVAPLYLGAVVRSFREAGYETVSMEFPAGENHKNINTLAEILEFFARCELTRSDFAVALGGGVVGDIVGFAAGCYMRGIDYVQMPTTLLSAVDSSVGGKTAIDLKMGKNLAGLFIQPKIVICDTDTMRTLDKDILADGAAEAIKTAILGDYDLFEQLENGVNFDNIIDVVTRCITYKGKIVEADEFEQGERKLLNLGHTPAHGIEKCSAYLIPHGRAVGMGMAIMIRAASKLEYMTTETEGRILRAICRCGLNISCPYTANELAEVAMSDKKR
ncbi:MAG: 3-dehydroquinate synthase, partial [Oscillospiraceae bacterium]|nr:3-dehydroquinate synthase [Oscillospiraceae bacterium]